MKAKNILGLIFLLAVFVAGFTLGKSDEKSAPPVLSGGAGGATYTGGAQSQDNELAVTGNSRFVAGPPMSDEVIVVHDGESIQDAVKEAQPGTTIRVMPGTYNETVYIDKDGIRLIGVIEEGERAVLDGEAGPYRDIVVLNAAGALCIAGKAEDIRSGVTMAREAIDSGAARNALDKLVEITNG